MISAELAQRAADRPVLAAGRAFEAFLGDRDALRGGQECGLEHGIGGVGAGHRRERRGEAVEGEPAPRRCNDR